MKHKQIRATVQICSTHRRYTDPLSALQLSTKLTHSTEHKNEKATPALAQLLTDAGTTMPTVSVFLHWSEMNTNATNQSNAHIPLVAPSATSIVVCNCVGE